MPGWRFSLDAQHPNYVLDVLARVQDTYNPTQTVSIIHRQMFTAPMYLDQFQRFIHKCMTIAIRHEADEWLRRDGVIIYNPHHLEIL